MIVRQIAHITISFLVLVSLTGISVKHHYCCGKLISSSLSFLDSNCMDGKMPPNSPCCQDEYQFFQVDEVGKQVHFSLQELMQLQLFVPEAPMAEKLFFTEKSKTPGYLQYRPPLIPQDIPVLIQSFLI